MKQKTFFTSAASGISLSDLFVIHFLKQSACRYSALSLSAFIGNENGEEKQ